MSEAQQTSIYNVVVPRFDKNMIGGTTTNGVWKGDVGEHVRATRRHLDLLEAKLTSIQASLAELHNKVNNL